MAKDYGSPIGEDAWTAIHYPNAVWDEAGQQLISDAEIAEVPFTAFTSRPQAQHVTARLIVCPGQTAQLRRRRGAGGVVLRLPLPRGVHRLPADPGQAEKTHRGHAIIEQVIGDLKSGPLDHLPWGKFTANAAWTVLAAIAFNLTRAATSTPSAFGMGAWFCAVLR